jgi:CRISPR/Cas system-associated endoribonuclease Cas2
MDQSRVYDLEELKRRWKVAGFSERRSIERIAQKISQESGFTRSMRESLIREIRQGRTQNVRDIHEWVSDHQGRF